ncbi:MAG: hypothetical protein AB7S48_03745 [Bacteroidales bacterium]
MKVFVMLIVLILLECLHLFGQNLVQNGDFETYEVCPITYCSKKYFLPNWYSPTMGTPDYFNECSNGLAGIPNNFAGKLHSENGRGYIGFIVVGLSHMVGLTSNYSREYVSSKLTKPLVKDTLYCISFLISHSTYSKITVNRISVYFSKHKVNKPVKKNELGFNPQINFELSVVPKDDWVLLSTIYRATGNEEFLTIGNFQKDTELVWARDKSQAKEKSPYSIGAYYYVDNVEIRPVSDKLSKCNVFIESEFTY